MSRGFFPIKMYEKRAAEFLALAVDSGQLSESRKKLVGTVVSKLFRYQYDKKIQPIFRLVRAHATQSAKFWADLHMASVDCGISPQTSWAKNAPLMMFGKTADTIKVFPNILLSKNDEASLSMCSGLLHWDAVDTIIKQYEAEKDDPLKGKKWENIARVWKFARKSEEMPTNRALARYCNMKNLSDAKVRDIAGVLDEMRKPIQLHFADTHEDIIKMYSDGPHSCMSLRGSQEKGWAFMHQKLNRHPCSFFVHHPHIRGVYFGKANKIAARTFLYQAESGKWQYGRVFGAHAKSTEQFVNALTAAGYTQLRDKYFREVEFKVEGVKSGENYIFPIPYFDNLYPSHVQVKYDDPTNMFTVTISKNVKGNIAYGSTNGFMLAKDTEGRKCFHCGRTEVIANGDNRYTVAVDGNAFCVPGHLVAHGYCYAHRADAARVWVPQATAIRDAGNGNYWYTNEAAAHAMRAYPYISSTDDIEEDTTTVSRFGNVIKMQGVIYRGNVGYWSEDAVSRLVYSPKTIAGENYYTVKGIPEEEVDLGITINIKYQKVVEVPDGFDPFASIAA